MGYAVAVAVPVLVVLTVAGVVYFLGPIEVIQKEEAQETVQQDADAFGDGSALIRFRAEVPGRTPEEDRVYVYIDGFYYGQGGGVPMKKENGTWNADFRTEPDRILRYKYNRNNFGFPTDEEFSPDSAEARREIDVGSGILLVNDEVKKWRWLSDEPPKAVVFSFEPESLPAREEDFVVGVSLLDFYQDRLREFVPSTLDRIKDEGFEYVGVSYSAATIVDGEPLKFSDEPINTYSKEDLEYVIGEARSRGLKVMLSVGISTDPENYDGIESEMSREHGDGWYTDLFVKWEDTMVNAARFAEENDVEILSVSNQWPFWGKQTDPQKKELNVMINGAFQKLQSIYSGRLTSDFYTEDKYYDYYKQMDWIGDKWWWPIARERATIVEEMRLQSKEIIRETYEPIYEKYKKPIFLSQLAYASYNGGAGAAQVGTEGPEVAEWSPYNPDYLTDFQEQADAYEAVFRAIQDEPMFVGAFSFGYGYWDSYDKSVGIRSKPAEKVLVKWNKVFMNETKE